MDPQQRLLLEIVYESIEDTGMTLEGLQGSDTAVYAGLMCSEYEALLLRDMDCAPTYFAAGTSRAIHSIRISYFFDWHGASMTIDTACSSSLVAVHQAVQALRAGESRMAVACGSNLILGPESYIIESKVKIGRGRVIATSSKDTYRHFHYRGVVPSSSFAVKFLAGFSLGDCAWEAIWELLKLVSFANGGTVSGLC